MRGRRPKSRGPELEEVDFTLFCMVGAGLVANKATWPLVARILPEDENVGSAWWGFAAVWVAFFVVMLLIVRGMQ